MIPPANHAASMSDGFKQTILFRLYVAGRAPHSLRAIAHLNELCRQYLPDRYQIELIDVLEEPLRALADGVLVTPTLMKAAPPPTWQMIGDLSQHEDFLLALWMKENER